MAFQTLSTASVHQSSEDSLGPACGGKLWPFKAVPHTGTKNFYSHQNSTKYASLQKRPNLNIKMKHKQDNFISYSMPFMSV